MRTLFYKHLIISMFKKCIMHENTILEQKTDSHAHANSQVPDYQRLLKQSAHEAHIICSRDTKKVIKK